MLKLVGKIMQMMKCLNQRLVKENTRLMLIMIS